MTTAYIVFFISLCIHGCRSQCAKENPFYMIDNYCANFNDICVKKDYVPCKSLLQACAQCPASNLTESALVNMLSILRDQQNKITTEANYKKFEARLNKSEREILEKLALVEKRSTSLTFKVTIIIVIVIGFLLVLIEMRWQPFKLCRRNEGASKDKEAMPLMINPKFDEKIHQTLAENQIQAITETSSEASTNYEDMKNLIDLFEKRINQKLENIENQIKTITETSSGASTNYENMTSLIHSLEEKINQKLENFQNQIQTITKTLSVTVPIKMRGITNPIKIQINRDDNAVKIKQKICAQMMNTKSSHFKIMVLKLNGTPLDDNQYLAGKIRSVEDSLHCDVIENLDPNKIVVVILRGNISLPEMIQFKKSETIEGLKSVLFQLTGEAADSLKLFRDSKEIDKLDDLKDYECLRVIKMHVDQISIKSIFDNIKDVLLSYSNVESVGDIKKKIADLLGRDADDIILFCDNKNLNDDVFLFEKDIEQLQQFKFCHFISADKLESIEKVMDGDQSEIFKRRNPWTGEIVVLKKYQLESMKKLQENKAFLNELITFQITKSQGGFVALNGVFKEKDYFYISMEKMEGSIKDYIKRNHPLSEEIIAKWAKQILLGLKYLHDNFIIHRNIKPSSILLDKDRNIKLSSFGIAKYVHWGDKEYLMEGFQQSRVGTYRYMAPEVCNENYGAQADVWSFGATMIEMATGKQPFIDKDESKALMEINNTKRIPYELDKTRSPKIKEFIDRCLKADPQIRATVGDLLKHDFLRPK